MAAPSPITDVPARPASVGGPDAVDARASRVVLSHVMGHQDTNLYGSVHGGAVMRLIDEAAAAAAGRHAGMPAVTVAVDGMHFLAPAHIGDLVTARAQLITVGRTSMRVQVVVTAERWNDLGPVVMVATAELVFVAVEHQGNPQDVPPFVAGDLEWLYETTTEPHPDHTFVPAEIGQRPRRRRDAEASPSTLSDF
ncbi:acyl-CoA thioesterase [Terrabacter sp. 2YAF2]|uniref:acyl-CoA thioesterase n=1 Tax=Terrabacter sp. 2YAF2 TaxID=3233026 RepID=UPI003F94AC2E